MIKITHEKFFFGELGVGDCFVIVPESFSVGDLPQYTKVSTETCVRTNRDESQRERRLSPELPTLKITVEEDRRRDRPTHSRRYRRVDAEHR